MDGVIKFRRAVSMKEPIEDSKGGNIAAEFFNQKTVSQGRRIEEPLTIRCSKRVRVCGVPAITHTQKGYILYTGTDKELYMKEGITARGNT